MNYQVTELHNIMPIANIPTVMQYGILSHEKAKKLKHQTVALQEVQERRDIKQVPGGLRLHQYANLYFTARNPMLFRRKTEKDSLCVLRISLKVLELLDVVITDRNASSDYVHFHTAERGLRNLDFTKIYAKYWNYPEDKQKSWIHKSIKCAEVLIPHCVPPEYIFGAYVATEEAGSALIATRFQLPVEINPDLFFV